MSNEPKTYFVGIREVWVQCVKVTASSEDEAKEKAEKASVVGDTFGDCEYSHTLDRELWSAEVAARI